MQIALIADTHLFYRQGVHPAYQLVTRKFLPKVKPDVVLILGDFMDFSYISKFSTGKWGLKEGVRLDEDIEYGRRELGWIQDKTHAEVIFLEGNHDYRLRALCETNPVMEGYFDLEDQMGLKGLGVGWVPRLEQPFKFGNVNYLHGEIATKYHVRKTLETYYANVVYGHVHRPQSDALSLPGLGLTLHGYSIGCLCELNPDYLKGRPSAWSLGFGWAWADSGHTTVIQVPVERDASFMFDGRLWK